jgi:hypothetical protein
MMQKNLWARSFFAVSGERRSEATPLTRCGAMERDT